MSILNIKRVSLLRYWTAIYFITLCLGLIVIAIVSALWIRHTTLEHRLNMTTFLAEEIADRLVYNNKGQKSVPNEEFPSVLKDRELETNPSIYIVSPNGIILSSNTSQNRFQIQSFPISILVEEKEIQRLQMNETNNYFYVVKKPILLRNTLFGWVVIIQSEDDLTKLNQEYGLLAIMIISLALLGWAAIYFLSRKLSSPIKYVADAAKQVKDGNYHIQLADNVREKELFELVHSFKEMANRLQLLEKLRAELLAGVTHELKTPVTSISGLLQAVKDDVVTGNEAKEFLHISLKEVERMQKMISDLLEFNSFSAHAIPISLEKHSIKKIVQEICHQWYIIEGDDNVSLQYYFPENEITANIDPLRLQQIVVNLLNNAKHAMDGAGEIEIHVHVVEDTISVDIKDSGNGIPEAEQELIFERFFRGEQKKYKVRGLGLGLPFSKMLAQAMDGDLVLKESNDKGTTFTIILPKHIT